MGVKNDNSHYWEDKATRAAIAKEHAAAMTAEYPNMIAQCIDNTHVWSTSGETKSADLMGQGTPKVLVTGQDTVSALYEHADGKTAVLNFASYKFPGGGFLAGSRAQEECLCHESFLYNVLSSNKLRGFYEWNKQNLNRGLYMNRALYSPGVAFTKDYELLADVITCASPNRGVYIDYARGNERKNQEELLSRIRFIKAITEKEGCNTLILGAFGCGVFSQDPEQVALFFKQVFARSSAHKIVYAVLGWDSKNCKAFRKVFP